MRRLPLVIVVAAFSAGFSNPGKVRTAHRQYAHDGRQYVVEYVYATNAIESQQLELWSPKAVLNAHYEAEITVFDVTDGQRVRVAEPAEGQYTELGCIEDAPPLLVEQALARARTAKRDPSDYPAASIHADSYKISGIRSTRTPSAEGAASTGAHPN